ncbi:MAG: hypothetical protein LBE74_02990 [Treponema sp.]|jgi:hypothetical protein|nr:hypothetical protein [Treponema sp.]
MRNWNLRLAVFVCSLVLIGCDLLGLKDEPSDADDMTLVLQPQDWDGGYGGNAYWTEGISPPVRAGERWRVTLKGKVDKAIPHLRSSLKLVDAAHTTISDEGDPFSVPNEPIVAGVEFTRTFTFTIHTDADITAFGIYAQTAGGQKVYDTDIVLTLSEKLKFEKIDLF